MTGVDLTTVDGISSHSALQLISEIGTDMNCWETDKQFCSWLSLCPGVNKTGGRKRSRSGRTRPSANRAARVLRLCANHCSEPIVPWEPSDAGCERDSEHRRQ